MGFGLRWLGRFASLGLIDRIGLRTPAERLVYGATKGGFKAASSAGRTFAAARKLTSPKRLPKAKGAGLFDLTPTTSSRCCARRSASSRASSCARSRTRPTPRAPRRPSCCSQAAELGLTMLGVPGGARRRRQRALGRHRPCWSPRRSPTATWASPSPSSRRPRVATALSLWGDADQQATYLPPFVGDDVAGRRARAARAAAPLFDPFAPATTARAQRATAAMLDGVKALVPRAAERRAVRRRRRDSRAASPACSSSRPKTPGVCVAAEPAMGLRAAATGRARLDDVELAAGALLGDATRRLRRVRAPRAARLVRAGGRHRPGRRSTT